MESLSAAQRAKIRRLSAPKELAPDEEGGELNIVPFLDIVTNVMMFVLATVSVTFMTMIDTQPPRLGGSSVRPPTKPSLSLNVVILKDGFLISAFNRRIGPGCGGEGAGLAIGKKTSDGIEDYDYEGLNGCVAKLKAELTGADFDEERQATISANHDVPFQAVVSTLDAIRKERARAGGGELRELFPEVNFGVPK